MSAEFFDVRKFYNDAMRGSRVLAYRWWQRARLRIGCAILGGNIHGAVIRLLLVYDRAKVAITEDGGVILANCEPLAEALYSPMHGHWTLTVTRIDDAAPADAPLSATNRGED